MMGFARWSIVRAAAPFAAGLALTLAAGCGDPVDRMLADEGERTRLWDSVAARPELSAQLVDRLLGADSTRTALLDRVLASGGARQALLIRVATDRSLMEGTIHFAVQDSAMRDHLKTLFRGMEMANPASDSAPDRP